MLFLTRAGYVAVAGLVLLGSSQIALGEDAFKIPSKTVKVEDLYKEDQSAFFEIEKQKYDLIERQAHEQYLEYYWQTLAKKQNQSVEQARDEYMKKNSKISDKEVAETLEKFKRTSEWVFGRLW